MLPTHPPREELKRAFALCPSGVMVATAIDSDGTAHGFTASSFVPLSLDPPMVLVCLNRSAQCYDAFANSRGLALSLLRPSHEALAKRFATRGADKFAGEDIEWHISGLPTVARALATFICRTSGRFPGGDHIILTAEIEQVVYEEAGAAMVHFRRGFEAVTIPSGRVGPAPRDEAPRL